MPQAKKSTARAKRKPAAKRPPEPEIQVNRMTEPSATQDDESQADRDAAGAARQKKVMGSQQDPVEDYEPQHESLEHAGFDHQAAEENRQAELQAERDEHNERTGDASL